MAVRPLRPATRLRLGGPLPRQLADRTQAHPLARDFRPAFGPIPPGTWSHWALAQVSLSCSHPKGRLPTCYSPVRHYPVHNIAITNRTVRLACVRHAASVSPEPGSNSPRKLFKNFFLRRSLLSYHGVFYPELLRSNKLNFLGAILRSRSEAHLASSLVPRSCSQ